MADLEARLADLAEAVNFTDCIFGDSDRFPDCPEDTNCGVCRAAYLHAVMLAAIEEASRG